jgi:hypothetical protein
MRYAAIGLLAAVLGVGCAVQTTDPGDDTTGEARDPSHPLDVGPALKSGNRPPGVTTPKPDNPQPAPWEPGQNASLGAPAGQGADVTPQRLVGVDEAQEPETRPGSPEKLR